MSENIFMGISEQDEREILCQLREVLTPEEYEDLIAKITDARDRKIKIQLTYEGAGLVERIRTSIFMSATHYPHFCLCLNKQNGPLVSADNVMKAWVFFITEVREFRALAKKKALEEQVLHRAH